VEIDNENDNNNNISIPIAGDDADTCGFYNIEILKGLKDKFSFDHFEVFNELIEKNEFNL
jgi:hypothetical protein